MARTNKEGKPGVLKFIVLGATIAVTFCALGYGIGRFQILSEIGSLEKQMEQRQVAAQEGLDSLRRSLEKEQKRENTILKQEMKTLSSKNAALEGRRELGRVLINLDDRNFGIAQQYLEKSVQNLSKAELLGEDIAAIVSELKKTKVVVAQNLNKQRALFRGYLDRLDGSLDTYHQNQEITLNKEHKTH